MFISKNSDTCMLEIERSLNSPINILSYGFHFRSTDLADKLHSYGSGSICNKPGKRLFCHRALLKKEMKRYYFSDGFFFILMLMTFFHQIVNFLVIIWV